MANHFYPAGDGFIPFEAGDYVRTSNNRASKSFQTQTILEKGIIVTNVNGVMTPAKKGDIVYGVVIANTKCFDGNTVTVDSAYNIHVCLKADNVNIGDFLGLDENGKIVKVTEGTYFGICEDASNTGKINVQMLTGVIGEPSNSGGGDSSKLKSQIKGEITKSVNKQLKDFAQKK